MNRTALACTSIAGFAILAAAALVAAGPLDPPAGPVTSTHKTLSEIEPRIPINATNTPGDADSLYKITQPGSYYLTGNIQGVAGKHGIEIDSHGVTLDLNGFDLVGDSASPNMDGVTTATSNLTNIAIRNGSIRNWGDDGVEMQGTPARGVILTDLRCSSNLGDGIALGNGASSVSNCVVYDNGRSGFDIGVGATVTACAAYDNGITGFSAGSGSALMGCSAYGNGGNGFSIGSSSTATGCSAYSNVGNGISAGTGSTVSACSVRSNAQNGLNVFEYCTITGNTAANNNVGIRVFGDNNAIQSNTCGGNDIGVFVTSHANRIDGNTCTNNDVSFDIDGVDNLVIRNSATGGVPNYAIVAGNSVAPRVSVTDSDGWAGISNANHPWANLGY